MKVANVVNGFDEKDLGNGQTEISTKGAGMGWIARVVMALFLTVPAAYVTSLLGAKPGSAFSLFLLIVIWASLGFGLMKITTASTKFTITPEGFAIRNSLYRFSDISEIILDNLHNKSGPIATGGVGIMVAGSGVSGAMVGAGLAASSALGSGLAAMVNGAANGNVARQYRVGFRHGKNTVYLARNQKLDAAKSLFKYLTERA